MISNKAFFRRERKKRFAKVFEKNLKNDLNNEQISFLDKMNVNVLYSTKKSEKK
jgi:hypothetical protein